MHVGTAYLQWRGKLSRHSRRMRTRNFAYLARGPWAVVELGHRLSLCAIIIFCCDMFSKVFSILNYTCITVLGRYLFLAHQKLMYISFGSHCKTLNHNRILHKYEKVNGRQNTALTSWKGYYIHADSKSCKCSRTYLPCVYSVSTRVNNRYMNVPVKVCICIQFVHMHIPNSRTSTSVYKHTCSWMYLVACLLV